MPEPRRAKYTGEHSETSQREEALRRLQRMIRQSPFDSDQDRRRA